jgi:hypothetical protein
VTKAFLDGGATVIGTSRKIQSSEFSSANFYRDAPGHFDAGWRHGARQNDVGSSFGVLVLLRHGADQRHHRTLEALYAPTPAPVDTPANRKAMPHADTSKWVQPARIAESGTLAR